MPNTLKPNSKGYPKPQYPQYAKARNPKVMYIICGDNIKWVYIWCVQHECNYEPLTHFNHQCKWCIFGKQVKFIEEVYMVYSQLQSNKWKGPHCFLYITHPLISLIVKETQFIPVHLLPIQYICMHGWQYILLFQSLCGVQRASTGHIVLMTRMWCPSMWL